MSAHRTVIVCRSTLLVLWIAALLSMSCDGGDSDDPKSPAARVNPVIATEASTHIPCARSEPYRQAFFGDTHVHTAFSFDASAQDTRNTPRDAYLFAKGAPMGIQPYDENDQATRVIRLDRPLDFTAVTDHSELLGEVDICTNQDLDGYDSVICRIHRNYPRIGFQLISGRSLIFKSRWGFCGDDGEHCVSRASLVWKEIQYAAEAAYDRTDACSFTSFVGYEWTATVGQGKNLHRNVIFANEVVPDYAPSWVDTVDAVALWDRLEADCTSGKPGCNVLTIPHNSNLSSGLMFESAHVSGPQDYDLIVDAEEARRRARFEPLVEIMQHKGDSECNLAAERDDEACGFEKLPYDRFGGKYSNFSTSELPSRSSHVRDALGAGLLQQSTLGANGLKYGIVAATDTHIAAPGLTREKDHPGHGGAGIGAEEALELGFPDDLEFGPGGLSVLWAEENTRESLFAAMQRREAYGTSGTRPEVRFFGGWDYPEDLCDAPDFVARGYADGVPMGSDLPPRPAPDTAPRFAFRALQDPGSATVKGTPLQRLQIIKLWLEGDEVREQVYDVAGGPNGASVDLETCKPRGDGHAELCSSWSDPDFDAQTHAVYYGRMLENPTCRWSQYVCLDARISCDEETPLTGPLAACCSEAHLEAAGQQERAWTSPIWYTPTRQ